MTENIVFVNKLYEESFNLLVEARNYFDYAGTSFNRGKKRQTSDALFLNYQALRLTSRMTQSMAWLLAQRAVEKGEISWIDACAGDFSLGAEPICTTRDDHEDTRIPDGMRALLDRSHSLYMRILRLDQAAKAKARAELGPSTMIQ